MNLNEMIETAENMLYHSMNDAEFARVFNFLVGLPVVDLEDALDAIRDLVLEPV